jgi:pimeloyl-ACP methyl ester carboxylesterase
MARARLHVPVAPKGATMSETSAQRDEIVRLNGIDVHYEIAGEGEPLLLLHGMTGCAADWAYAGREELARAYRLILVDARGHGRSTNPAPTFQIRQCALDMLALLDHLGIGRCRAIGASLGGGTLLHLATLQPDRVQAMVVVSTARYFPEQARRLMRLVPVENQPAEEWQVMRQRHPRGDEQILALWRHQRSMADSYDDMTFTPPALARITADTLIVAGDRDPLYPVEMAVDLYRAIPRSALWVLPNAGHGPIYLDAAPLFAKTALEFFRAGAAAG